MIFIIFLTFWSISVKLLEENTTKKYLVPTIYDTSSPNLGFGTWEIERSHAEFVLLVKESLPGSWAAQIEGRAAKNLLLRVNYFVITRALEISYSAQNIILKSIICFANITFQL